MSLASPALAGEFFTTEPRDSRSTSSKFSQVAQRGDIPLNQRPLDTVTSILFSTVAVPIYIPTNSVGGLCEDVFQYETITLQANISVIQLL